MADSLCVTFKNVIKFTSCVPLQSTLPLNGVKSKEMYPRCYHYTVCLSCSGRAQVVRYHRCNSCRSCLFSRNISITVSSEAPSPLRYVLPYLYRLYYLHSSSLSISSLFQSEMLQVVSVYVSVTLPFLSSLPLPRRQLTGMATPDCMYF